MSLEQTAKQMRKQYMTVSDKYCEKHQRHYVTIQFPNSKPYTCLLYTSDIHIAERKKNWLNQFSLKIH